MTVSTSIDPGNHPEERRRGRAVIRSGALTLFQRQAFTPILDVIRNELSSDAAGITIIYEESAFIIAASGFPVGRYNRSDSFCAHTILQPEELMIVPDLREDDRFNRHSVVQRRDGFRFYAGMQLLDDDRMPLGALWVVDKQPRDSLTNAEIACLRRVSQAVTAMMRRHAAVTVE
jgi:GAF domain-containing protein